MHSIDWASNDNYMRNLYSGASASSVRSSFPASSIEADHWMDKVASPVDACDAKLLRRYIPALPLESLQKVVTVSNSARIACLASKREQSEQRGADARISKMAMRLALGSTFAQLALADTDIQEVHTQWEATNDKSKRRRKACAQRHAEQWHERAQNRRG